MQGSRDSQALVPVGTYTIDVTVADDGVPPPVLTAATSLTPEVVHEPVAVTLDPANVAVLVADDGADSAPFTLALTAAETDDPVADNPGTGRGDLSLAQVSVELVPIGPGAAVGPVACATTVDPSGEPLSATCDLPGVAANLYDVVVSAGGDHYVGGTTGLLTVYDPPQGAEKSKGTGTFALPATATEPATEVTFDFSAETKPGNTDDLRCSPSARDFEPAVPFSRASASTFDPGRGRLPSGTSLSCRHLRSAFWREHLPAGLGTRSAPSAAPAGRPGAG